MKKIEVSDVKRIVNSISKERNFFISPYLDKNSCIKIMYKKTIDLYRTKFEKYEGYYLIRNISVDEICSEFCEQYNKYDIFINNASERYFMSLEKLSSYNNAFIGCVDYKGKPFIYFQMNRNYTFNKSLELKIILKNKKIDKIDIVLKSLFKQYLSYINKKYEIQIENIFTYSRIDNTWANKLYSNIVDMEECYIIKGTIIIRAIAWMQNFI